MPHYPTALWRSSAAAQDMNTVLILLASDPLVFWRDFILTPEANVTFKKMNPGIPAKPATISEFTVCCRVRINSKNAWHPHNKCSTGGGGGRDWTHLSAHGAVDGDDNKALNRVKDGKENLEEINEMLLLVSAHLFNTAVVLKHFKPWHPP